MNTPAHLIFGVLAFRNTPRPGLWWAALAGALIPDAPMFLFYGYEKGILGTPERVIWSQAYWDPAWQLLIDIPNSIPLALLGWFLARRMGSGWGQAFFLSAGLHQACDFALHHDDGHRHLLPFSDWRFVSPVSYWDPRHFGRIAAPVEAAMTVAACVWLLLREPAKAVKAVAGVTLAVYGGFAAFAFAMWG